MKVAPLSQPDARAFEIDEMATSLLEARDTALH